MHGPVLVLDGVAILCVAAALGAAFVLYGTWKTRVLMLYMVFITTIAAFSVSMALQNVSNAIEHCGVADETVRTLAVVGLLLQSAGGVVHVAVLPHFVYAINNRHPSVAVQRAFLVVAVVMGAAAAVFVVDPGLAWIGFALTGMLFLSIAWCIVRMLVWIWRSDTARAALDTSRSLRSFVWVSLAFLPVFIADVVVSRTDASATLAPVDGISVPAYLILLTIGSIIFAKSRLGMPPLYQSQQLTSFCKERYSLTNREAEVVEYVMEGYSVPDLASVLKISKKTAEHHLYSAYQKLAVSNRVQLFQTLMAHN
jgi:DNA-binding CsgD family transcriptional regulator